MTNKLIRPLISCLLIIALLVPAVAQAMPAAPAGPSTWPAETLRDNVVPASLQSASANSADNDSSVDSAAPHEPVGRLLLSPAIDADGDPLTNPIAFAPVHRVDGGSGQEVLYAEVSLAAEVIPHEANRNPAGVEVTFRIWHETAPLELVRTTQADAWGAAAVRQIFDDLHLAGRWFYQASAPGYGETPVRAFSFDTSSFAAELWLDAVRITAQREANGRLVVDITSDVAMDDSPSAAELIVMPVTPAAAGEDAPATRTLPPMVAQRIDPYHARAQIFLDGGDYEITALVHAGRVVAQSAPARLSLPANIPPPIQSVDAIYEPSPDGATALALYRTPDGDAALVRRALADLPPPADPVEPPILQERRRVGPFQWQVETYNLQVQVLADDGKKRAYLDDVSWDPISRSYDVVIESLMDEPVEDKLTVKVFGPGQVVIHEETVPIVLDPARPLRHTVTVPADLGEPHGLQITVHDPLDVVFSYPSSGMGWLVAKMDSYIDDTINSWMSSLPAAVDITGSLKGTLVLLGIELASWTKTCTARIGCTPASTGGLIFQTDQWDVIVLDGIRNYLRDNFQIRDLDEAVKRFKTGLPLTTGTGTLIVGLRYTRSYFDGRCNDPIAQEFAKRRALTQGRVSKEKAAKLSSRYSELATALQRDPWEPLPAGPTLAVQFAPIFSFQLEADYAEPYSVWNEFNASLGMQIIVLLRSNADLFSLVGKAWSYYEKIQILIDLLEGLIYARDIAAAMAAAHQFKAHCPDPEPDGDPDDRRDASTNQFFPEPAGTQGAVMLLSDRVATAQRLGLSRAETYWTLQLRRAEQAAHRLDPTTAISDTLEEEVILIESQGRADGLLNGAILPEPGQTITDAVTLVYDDFFYRLNNTSGLRRKQELQQAVDFAQRQYSLLHGQELALQQELRTQLAQAGLGVMDSGLVNWALTAMGSLGVKAAPVQILAGASSSNLRDSRYYTPYDAPSVLVIPSGGLHRYSASQEARAWLETYVNLGGTLIVLAQANGRDWELLPGGQVHGLGYEEDILCKTASVRIVNGSPWIKGIGRDLPDIQIDGSFTEWPAGATVVLMRTTGNQMPAMIEYAYGAGRIVAMSAYPDFYINGMQSLEDIVFARSLFGLAYLHATGQSVAAAAAGPGAPVSLPVEVTNTMAVDAAELTLARDYYVSNVFESWRWSAHRPRPLQGTTTIDLAPDLPSGATATVTANFAAPPQAGIFRVGRWLSNRAYSGLPANWWNSGSQPGPFYEVQSAYTPPPGFSLVANRDRFAFGETATITATVQNNLATPRTLTLTPAVGLDDGPVVLNLPASGAAQHVYTTRIYGRRDVRLELLEGGAPLNVMPLTLQLSPPFLGLETAVDRLPAGLATSVAVTATLVDGRASQVSWEARVAGTLVDSATTALAPSGAYSITAASLSLPAAAVGDEVTIRAALVGASAALTRTLPVQAPLHVAGVSLTSALRIGDANSGRVRVQLDGPGFAGSGQVLAHLRRDSDLALVASGPALPVALGSGSQTVQLDLPLPVTLDAAQRYSVLVEASGQATGGAPVADSRALTLPPIDLRVALMRAVTAVRQPMPLRVFPFSIHPGLLPTGPFTVTVAISETVPSWSATQVATATEEIATVRVNATTPDAPRGGDYRVTVQTPQLVNWSQTDLLRLPHYDLRYLAPSDVISAGQPLTWTVSNVAGVDTTLHGALSLLDEDGVAVAQRPVAIAAPILASTALTLSTPSQVRSGPYRLQWSGVDHLGKIVGDVQQVALDGLAVALDSQTDLPAYLSNETVTALSVITASAALEDANLRLRVVSRGNNPYFGDQGEPGVVVTTVAGGAMDAMAAGKALRYDLPGGIAFSPAGDHVLLGNGRVIQKVDTSTWQGRVLAGRNGMGNSAVDGVGLNARFAANLMSVSTSGDGSFAILVEFGRGIIRRYDTATGAVSFVAGIGGGCADGPPTTARFNFPSFSAVSHDGSFALVTDTCGLRHIDLATGNVTTLAPGAVNGVAIGPADAFVLVTLASSHVVSLVTLPGGAVTTLAGTAFSAGSADGVGSAARFDNPAGVAISADGTFALVADRGNATVRRISLPGAGVTTLAGAVGQQGFVDGIGAAARFDGLRQIAVSPDKSYALLEDTANDAVRRLDLATNSVTTVLGNWPGADGLANEARFVDPWDVAVSPDGGFALIADASSATIRRMDLTTGAVTTVAGAYNQTGTVDGIGAASRFYFPSGVAISPDGSTALVVDDAHNVVRKIDLLTAEVTTVAGAANLSGFVNGVGGAARFNDPEDVVFSPDGSYALIADWGNEAVRKLDMATAEVTTFVAPGTGGMNDVRAIDISSDGSFALVASVADYAIFRVDVSGGAATGVALLAGGGYDDVVDGIGAEAKFDWPAGVTISPDGSMALVSEQFAKVIRLIDLATAEVTTVAGAPWEDDTMRDGPGAAARILWPIGLDFGPDGAWALTTVQLGNAIARLDLTTVPKALVQTVANRPPASDGPGPEARLYNPSAVAVSADGTFAVVADSGNNAVRYVALISPERAATIAALADAGDAGDAANSSPARPAAGRASANEGGLAGPQPTSRQRRAAPPAASSPETANDASPFTFHASRFPQPAAPSIDLPPAVVNTLAGQSGSWGSDDGTLSAARFNWPEGIALSPNNSFVLVADTWNHTIRRINLATAVVTTVAGSPEQSGSADGVGSAARFNVPTGIAVSPDASYALIADDWNHTIRRLDIANGEVTTLAGQAGVAGSADGVGSAARFNYPRGLAISDDGSFALVADDTNATIRRIDLLTNAVTTVAGQAGVYGYDDGVGSAARFRSPTGVSISADGSSALVVDSANYLLRQIDLATATVTTLAGEPEMFGYDDGVGSAARFAYPFGVALSSNGGWALVVDSDGGAMRYVDMASRAVATLVSLPLHEDGAGPDVRFNWPYDLDMSADGSIGLVVDTWNNTIRRLDVDSGEVTTVAGDATDWPGSADGIGSAARWRQPQGGALDAAGAVAFIADTANHTIRRVDMQTGAVTTIAGSAGAPGNADGVGSAARFRSPARLALSPDESYLLVSDTLNHAIRRLDLLTYQVTTVAGNPGFSGNNDGIGTAARFDSPQGVAISSDGSYALIADTENHMVRRLDLLTGRVTRLAGGRDWDARLDGFFDSAYFSQPRGIAISADSSYALVTDAGSGLVRRIGLTGPDALVVTTLAGDAWNHGGADGVGSTARFYWSLAVATSDDPTSAYMLDAEGMTVRRLGLPGQGVSPAAVLRQQWQPVAGARGADSLAYTLPFVNPNLLDDGRARGQLWLEADLYSNAPADVSSLARRHRLASASYPFLVDDASGGLAFSSRRLVYRRNVPGYAPDDAASAVTLNGLVRNTAPTTATIQLTITRDGSTLVSSQTFSGLGPDETRFFSAVDPNPPAGAVVYLAADDVGNDVAETVIVQVPDVDAVVSAQPASIALGEATTLAAALANNGSVDAYVSADLGGGVTDHVIAAGATITLTHLVTPTTAGPVNLPVTLSGDLQGVQAATVTVRNESAAATIALAGQVRTGRAPFSDPQLVRGDDAGLVFAVNPLQASGFDALASYTVTGPASLAGSELVSVQPGGTAVTISLAGLPAGVYHAALDVQHARLGTALDSASLAFELVEPAYALSLAATVTGLDGSIAQQVDISTASGAASEGIWSGSLRLSGALADEDPLSLAPGASSTRSETVAMENHSGEQTVLVELVNSDGSVAASQAVSVHAAPRAAPAATLTGLSADPAPAGSALTIVATVQNAGPAGEALLEVVAFDQVHQLIGEAAGAASSAFTLSVPTPPDLLAGSYPVLARLGDQELRIDAEITGAQIELRQTLNAAAYQPYASATWTVEVEGVTGAPAQYDVEMRFGDQAHTQTISIGAGQTVQLPWTFPVGPVSERATVLVQTHPLTPEQTRHSLLIDSQWIPVIEDGRAWLQTDKARYDAGETVHLTYHLATPTQSATVLEPDGLLSDAGPQLWSSLEVSPTAALTYTVTITDPVSGSPVQQTIVLTDTYWVQGDFPFDYTLPATVATGRYFFRYFFGGEERTWPIDVFGVDLAVADFTVSGPGVAARGAAGGPLSVSATLKLNQPLASARITAYALDPDDNGLSLGPTAVMTTALPAGETPVTLHGVFAPEQPGPHRIVLSVRDADTLAQIGGESAAIDVGKASISSLATDQGTYLPGQPGTGALTVYGIGATTLVVTDTVGNTLLNTTATLGGFQSFSFPIHTATVGDYLLSARLGDATGMTDTALRAYAVPLPADTEAPVVTFTNPTTHTILFSGAPTVTLTVEGVVTDNRGPVTLYVNGKAVTALAESSFSTPVVLSQGGNGLSAVALDEAGNYAATPMLSVNLAPQATVTLTPDRTSGWIGEQLVYESTLSATGPLSDARWVQFLPPGGVINVAASASSGSIANIVSDAAGTAIVWQGDAPGSSPVTMVVTATLNAAGVLTSTATVIWGPGLTAHADAAEVQVNSPLAVQVASFSAAQVGEQALLAWETVSEIDHLGFNLYRGADPAGPWTRVNDGLIPSPSPGSTTGHLYELLDPVALPPGVTWYRLEAVDTRGAAEDAGLTSISLAGAERGLWLPLVVRGAP